jgi:hypothetical protein
LEVEAVEAVSVRGGSERACRGEDFVDFVESRALLLAKRIKKTGYLEIIGTKISEKKTEKNIKR